METVAEAKGVREFDMDKVKTTLKQFARDWSKEVDARRCTYVEGITA